MTRRRVHAPLPWIPNEDELRVIESLATGHSQNRTAEITGIPQRTISGWYSKPEFRQCVADMAAQFISSRENVHEQSLALAELIVHQGLTGERRGDDAALDLAVRLLERTAWPLRRGEVRTKFGQLPPGGDTA